MKHVRGEPSASAPPARVIATLMRPSRFRLTVVWTFATAVTLAALSGLVGTVDAAARIEADVMGGPDARPIVLQTPSTEAIEWPFSYARALRGVPVHNSPGGARINTLSALGRWVAFTDRRVVSDQAWLALAIGGWAPESSVAPASLPTFKGIDLQPHVHSGRLPTIGFVVAPSVEATTRPDGGEIVTSLPRYTAVAIVAGANGESGFFEIGPGVWAPASGIRTVPWNPRPAQIPSDVKWIDVDLGQQVLVAYEGDQPVFATLVSTGLPRTPTWQGVSRIWMKLLHGKMSGGDTSIPGDYYWLDHVPHTQYFHQGYGLHAAYWHDDFGRTKSHGCVNLSPADARRLFEWTTPQLPDGERTVRSRDASAGTYVWTHP